MKARVAIVAAMMAAAGFCEEPALSDAEIWNEGVEFYRAGDFTNATRVLRALMLSKTHGARAAEVVAALAHEKALRPATPDSERLGALEEAAAAAQLALRSKPDDARARRNFSRAVDGLEELRETKKLNDLLASAQNSSPEAIIAGAKAESRALMALAGSYRTNAAPAAVALADSLSARAEKLADKWTILREAIAQSVTNAEEAATATARVDEAQGKSREAAKAFADFTDGAYSPLAQAEQDFHWFYKRIAGCKTAIAEDFTAQSNAWQDVEAFNGRAWQPDALEWTRMFRLKFPEWAQSYEQRAQSDTNLPPFTAEAQAKVSALSTELEKLQLECVKDILPPKQEEALNIIREIMELLPDEPGQGGQSGQSGQGKQDNKDKSKNDKSEGENKDEGENNQDESDLGEQESAPEEEKEQEASAGEAAEESDESEDSKEIEAILKKAQERADEHEADKKARMRKAPLPPNEKDW